MRPFTANFYSTYKCNDMCEFCGFWQDESLRDVAEAPLEDTKKVLQEIREMGVPYLDVTGGEPLLRDDIGEIVKFAKELGFYVALTTNCLLYPEKAKEITPYVDRLLFSVDSPMPDEHDRIRGVACFDKFSESVKVAASLGKSPTINFTATRESIATLPDMVELARAHNLLLWINPVFDYGALEGFEPETIEHIKYYASNKHVAFSHAALEFIRSFGNNEKKPRCRAAQASITVTPDLCLMIPCHKNKRGKIKIETSVKETLENSKGLSKEQGKMEICRGCMMWPYMIPSFFSKIDKYFFMSLWSLFDLYRKEYELQKGGKK